MNSHGMGSSSSGSFPLVLTQCASLGSPGQVPKCPSLWLPLLSDCFLHPLEEAVSALREHDVLNPHMNSLAKYLTLNLLVYNDAHGVLGDTAHFQFCHGNTYGALLFEQYPFP